VGGVCNPCAAWDGRCRARVAAGRKSALRACRPGIGPLVQPPVSKRQNIQAISAQTVLPSGVSSTPTRAASWPTIDQPQPDSWPLTPGRVQG
jgi:hypothetical protein